MSKHTPGPWRVISTDGANGIAVVAASGKVICDNESYFDPCNAHLIAAAPMLLEACKALIAHHRIEKLLNVSDTLDERVRAVRAAIRAAEGE